MLIRPDERQARQRARKAANARRLRLRRARGQKVYRVTAYAVPLTAWLFEAGLLPDLPGDVDEAPRAMIEAALTRYLAQK